MMVSSVRLVATRRDMAWGGGPSRTAWQASAWLLRIEETLSISLLLRIYAETESVRGQDGPVDTHLILVVDSNTASTLEYRI